MRYDTTTKELEKAKNISLFTAAFNCKQTIVNVRLKLCLGSALKKLILQFYYVRMLKDTKSAMKSWYPAQKSAKQQHFQNACANFSLFTHTTCPYLSRAQVSPQYSGSSGPRHNKLREQCCVQGLICKKKQTVTQNILGLNNKGQCCGKEGSVLHPTPAFHAQTQTQTLKHRPSSP